jgi:type IV pilus assembly protein PilO
MKIDVKNPNLIRWALTVLVVATVVPMYFLSTSYPFTYASRSQTIKELDDRHQKLSAELERARLLVRNLERVEQEYAILHDQWKVAATLLPDENEMPDLLRKVTAAGQQSGVEFEIFKPGAVANQGFYSDNPVEVRISGGYHQTGVFLSRLANLNRIVNVSKLKMQGVDNPEGRRLDGPHRHAADGIHAGRRQRATRGDRRCDVAPAAGQRRPGEGRRQGSPGQGRPVRWYRQGFRGRRPGRQRQPGRALMKTVLKARPGLVPALLALTLLLGALPVVAADEEAPAVATAAAAATAQPAETVDPGTNAEAADAAPADASLSPSQISADRINAIRANEYFYQSYGKGDPFATLVNGEFQQTGAAELVDVNSASLVGVMWGQDDRFALVEDGEGFGYILRVGDQVRNGRVVSIRKNSLTAQVTLYGITSNVVLKLDNLEE